MNRKNEIKNMGMVDILAGKQLRLFNEEVRLNTHIKQPQQQQQHAYIAAVVAPGIYNIEIHV